MRRGIVTEGVARRFDLAVEVSRGHISRASDEGPNRADQSGGGDVKSPPHVFQQSVRGRKPQIDKVQGRLVPVARAL